MESHHRENVAKFLANSQPRNGGWTEKRLAFEMNGNVFIIENNFPHWTESQILEWLKVTGIEYFEIEVKVVPEARMGGKTRDGSWD